MPKYIHRKPHPLPPPPEHPVKMLWEYKYNELPPSKKVVVDAMMRVYLNWLLSQPENRDELEADPDLKRYYHSNEAKLRGY